MSRPPGFLVAACGAVALLSATLSSVVPLVPHFADQMHSSLYAALVVAGHPFGSLLSSIPTLYASRRFGLPRVIMTGGLLFAASSVVFIWPGRGWWIVLARVGLGAAATAIWQSVFAWAITNSGPGRRARTIGTLIGASTAGNLTGPQIGALAAHYGIWICAIPPLVLVGTTARFALMRSYEMLEWPSAERIRAVLGAGDARRGLGINAIFAVVGLGIAVALPLRLADRGVTSFGIGAILTGSSALLALASPTIGRQFDHGRMRALVGVAFVAISLALLGLDLVPLTAGAVAFAFAANSLGAVPMLAGQTLLSRATAAAKLDQTVSQVLATISWAPFAILGSVASGALPSRTMALALFSCITLLAAGAVAAARPAPPRSVGHA